MSSSSPPPPERNLQRSKRKASKLPSPILQEDTIKRVKTRDQSLIGDEYNGKRTISLSLLTPPPSSSNSRSSSALSSTSTISIPVEMDSPHTYECMGLTAEAARSIYNDGKEIRDGLLNDYGEDFNSDFLECSLEAYLVKRVNEVCDDVLAAGDGDNWNEAMTAAGIKKELQDAIMDEEFEAIRGTMPLQSWLKEIFNNYFLTFEHMNESVLDLEENSSGPSLRGGAGEEDISPPPPGHRALFKSVEFHRAQGIFLKDRINLDRLTSVATPMDFTHRNGLYFTDALWVAEVYATFSKRTCPPADIRTVEIHVPEDHFRKQKVWELEFDDTFKEIVWHSRRGELLPKNLQKIRSGFRIIHGPCTTQHSKNYAKMKHWNEITDKHLLTRTTTDEYGASKKEVAMQYLWRNDAGVTELNIDCKGKVRVWKPLKGWSLVEDPEKDISVKGRNVLKG
ncbi:hypothetical protein COCVIDRAFT_18263 [Bipolaris victoriae FI3]|uniref:Uncharacterized protein n=1 Tax=Bipolaris victoriae (strain FI3) TaxID=930091 RepID=W7EJB3_BIPV3|nr:hypothetical protein COCVIDRAFT_18263 [Bipolaris victoriae FI3]